MLAITFAALWLIIALAPETPIGKACRRWLVEAPARQLSGVRRDTILIMMIFIGGLGIASLIGGDASRIAAFAGPDLVAFLTTIELGTYLDIAVGALLVVPTLRFGTIKRWIAGMARRPLRRARPRSTRPRNTGDAGRGANDDDHPCLAWAA